MGNIWTDVNIIFEEMNLSHEFSLYIYIYIYITCCIGNGTQDKGIDRQCHIYRKRY